MHDMFNMFKISFAVVMPQVSEKALS